MEFAHMGGRMKHVIVSINPLGRFLYIHDVRVQTRVSLFAQQRSKSDGAPIIYRFIVLQ